eukprot:3234417-Prymnesium_polylepis.2
MLAASLSLLAWAPAPNASNPTELWPLPKTITGGSSRLTVAPSPSFFTMAKSIKSPLLEAAFARYGPLTFPHAADVSTARIAAPVISALTFDVCDLDESHPQLATDESYSLSIPASGGVATAKAKTVFGALRQAAAVRTPHLRWSELHLASALAVSAQACGPFSRRSALAGRWRPSLMSCASTLTRTPTRRPTTRSRTHLASPTVV